MASTLSPRPPRLTARVCDSESAEMELTVLTSLQSAAPSRPSSMLVLPAPRPVPVSLAL